MDNTNFKYVDIRNIQDEHIDHNIFVRARIHKIRITGKICFIILRYQTHSIQVIANKTMMDLDKFKELKKLTPESFVDCYGKLRRSPIIIHGTTYKNIEMEMLNVNIISLAKPLPFLIDDANDLGESFRSDVKFQNKLDHRWIDLRTPTNNIIFKIQSAITQYFKDFLLQNNFIEIHSPKLIGVASEGGAQVFEVKYFNQQAFLAQSPQLYKQMAINADFDRVFEVGPVFRAEKSFSTRHLCEFIGLDLEMTINPNQTYKEVQYMLWNLLTYIFDCLKQNYQQELEYIKEKTHFEYPDFPKDPLIINFKEVIRLLKEDGKNADELEDLTSENEKRIGEIIQAKYNSDLFIIDQYPLKVRPFYTMPCETDSNYSNSFDIVFKGVEISSGAQRIHDYNMLMENVIKHQINPLQLKHYLDSFAHGSRPHGGMGIGLDRLTSLYLNLGNVKLASFCPRDPCRLFP